MTTDRRAGADSAASPVYLEIAGEIRGQINSGELAHGDRLPTESALTQRYNVARMTVRKALEILEMEGLIDRRRGRHGGTFVRGIPPVIELTRIEGILPQLREQGVQVDSEVLRTEKILASVPLAKALEIKVGDPVFNIGRLRSFDGVPSLIEDSYFPADIFPRMLEANLGQSIYELLENLSHRPVSKVEQVASSGATSEERALLNVSRSLNLLRIKRVARDDAGRAVEYSLDLLRSDSTQIRVVTGDTRR